MKYLASHLVNYSAFLKYCINQTKQNAYLSLFCVHSLKDSFQWLKNWMDSFMWQLDLGRIPKCSDNHPDATVNTFFLDWGDICNQ